MSKLTRGAYRTFLDAAFGGTGTPKWWRLGKYTDDLSVNLNPDVSSNKNVWDESYVEDNGYEPSIESTTYYADPTDPIYPKLQDMAMNRLKGDDCRTTILEVIVEDTAAAKHRAWKEDVVVKPEVDKTYPYHCHMQSGHSYTWGEMVQFDRLGRIQKQRGNKYCVR